MSYIDTIKLGRLNQSYDVLYDKNDGVNTVTTLTNLPVTKNVVLANLAASSPISLAGSLKVGEELQVICNPTADFGLDIGDAIERNFEGSIIATNGKKFGLNIVCYNTGKYFLTADVAVGAIKIAYEYTFNIIPETAIVTIKVNNKPISGKTVIVEKGSNAKYVIESEGFETVTGSIAGDPFEDKVININLVELADYKEIMKLQAGDILLKNGGFKDKSKIAETNASDISGIVLGAPYRVLPEYIDNAADPAHINQRVTDENNRIIDILKVSKSEYKQEFSNSWKPYADVGAGLAAYRHYGNIFDTSKTMPVELVQHIMIQGGIPSGYDITYKAPLYFDDNITSLHEAYLATGNNKFMPDNITYHYAQESNAVIPNGVEEGVARFYEKHGLYPMAWSSNNYWTVEHPTIHNYFVYTSPTLFTLKKFVEIESNITAVIDSFAKIVGDTPDNIRNMINSMNIHACDVSFVNATDSYINPFTKCSHQTELHDYYYGWTMQPWPDNEVVFESSYYSNVSNLLDTSKQFNTKVTPFAPSGLGLFPVAQMLFTIQTA